MQAGPRGRSRWVAHCMMDVHNRHVSESRLPKLWADDEPRKPGKGKSIRLSDVQVPAARLRPPTFRGGSKMNTTPNQKIGSSIQAPEKAREDPAASKLGLAVGLRAEICGDWFRCGECHKVQPRGSIQVWVPEGAIAGDPTDYVTELARRYAWNGFSTAWCLPCASRFRSKKNNSTSLVWLRRLLARVF